MPRKNKKSSKKGEENEETISLEIVDEKQSPPPQESENEIRQRRFHTGGGSSSAGGSIDEEYESADEEISTAGWLEIYDNNNREYISDNQWLETDPETNQTFNRLQQQSAGLMSLIWGGGPSTSLISREDAWKMYLKKLQDESNYLLATPDKQEICCCQECILEYELQCNEVLGWRKRAPTVEGFSKEVNKLCDPTAQEILGDIIQEKYRSLPCSIM